MAELDYEQTLSAEKAKTMEQTDRKCPQCGATMDFDPATGGLFCPFCEYREEIKAENDLGQQKAEELDLDSAEHTENCDWGVSKKTVTCKSCGAVTVYDALEVSNECPYCGSNQVMEANDVNTMAPGGVVPFKISLKEAGEKFTKWLAGKWFAPKAAKMNAKADAFNGVYLPYWTFDTNTDSTYTAEYGIDKTVGEGDEQKTITKWYRTRGNYEEFVDDELICATSSHNTAILKSVEPYNTEDNKAYKPEYLAGFAAERYSLGLKEAWEKAKALIFSRIENNIHSKIIRENHADRVRNLVVNTRLSNITYKYLLLPIWLSAFNYNGKVYQFMVNGQTGKVGGNYPVSPWRVLLAILIAVAICTVLYLLLFYGS